MNDVGQHLIAVGVVMVAAVIAARATATAPSDALRQFGGAVVPGVIVMAWAIGGGSPLPTLLLAVALTMHATGDPGRTLVAQTAAFLCAIGLTGCTSFIDAAVLVPACTLPAFLAWHPGTGRWWTLAVIALTTALATAWSDLPVRTASAIACAASTGTFVAWMLTPGLRRPAWLTLPPFWRWFTLGKNLGDPIHTLLLHDSRPWGRVLDVGCGHGLGALIAHQRGNTTAWTGIDLDQRKLHVANHLLARLSFRDGACTRLGHLPDIDADSADTILAIDILHYWPPDQQTTILAWLHRHLLPDGRLWLREMTADGTGIERTFLGERFTTAIGLNPSGPIHIRRHDEWEASFRAAGLAVLSAQPAGAANVLWCLTRG